MNSFAMAIHTVLEAVSELLHAGDARIYLLLTCTSILFTLLMIFRRRKDETGELSNSWESVSATTLDTNGASESSSQSLKSYFTQHQDTSPKPMTTIHRKHGNQCQLSECFLASTYNEDTRDNDINEKLSCNRRLEPIPRGAKEAVVNQHKLPTNPCEQHLCTTDPSHSGELSQWAITDTSHKHELSQTAIRDTYQTDELSRPAIRNACQPGEVSQHSFQDISHRDELSRRTLRNISQTNELSQQAIRNSSPNDELPQLGITDSSSTDGLSLLASTDSSHTDELSQPAIRDTRYTDELSQPVIGDTHQTDEVSQSAIRDTTHVDELSQQAIRDTCQTDEVSQPAIRDTSQTDELSQSAIRDTCQTDELSQLAIRDTGQTDELSHPAIRDTCQTDELSHPAIRDTCQTDELSQLAIRDTGQTDELSHPAIRDTGHTDELSHPAIRDTCQTVEQSQSAIRDTCQTDELSQSAIRDTHQTDEVSQSAIRDTCQTNELSHPAIRDTCQTDEQSQLAIRDTYQTDEVSQPAIRDTCQTVEQSQSFIEDSCNSGELFERAFADFSESGDLFQQAFNNSFHLDELSQRALIDISDSGDLFQRGLTDSCRPSDQPSLHERSSSNLVQEGILTTSSSCCDSGQDVNIVDWGTIVQSDHQRETMVHTDHQRETMVHTDHQTETTVPKGHQREITHALTYHHKRNKYQKEIILHNKEKIYTGNPESVNTVLICDQDNDQPKLLWRQLSLDSRKLPRSQNTIRTSSTSDIVHTCDKYARELKMRHRDHARQSAATFCTVNSCKGIASSEVSSFHSPANSDARSVVYRSSSLHCADKLPDSACTCMCKSAHTQNNPVFSQEISYHKRPVSSECPEKTCITVEHSFPMTRSKYNGFRSNSERRASRSHKQMSNMFCQRLGEISPQRYATIAHTTLGNSYSQEPMSPQSYATTAHTTLGESYNQESMLSQRYATTAQTTSGNSYNQESVSPTASCVIEANSLTDYLIPLHHDRISSNLSHSSASAAILYRNPKQRHMNRRYRAIELEGHDFPNISPSTNFSNNLHEMYSSRLHPQAVPETAMDGHTLGKMQSVTTNTSNSQDTQVQLRRKRWGKSFFIPTERSKSMQMDFIPRALSLAIPVKSQSNDSLSRRRLATLGDMEQHLSTHTKGIFRKRVSVNNMLTWSKDPIQKPMIRSKDKGLRKAACELFKMIQTYMGDRKGKQARESVALDVVTRGWTTPSLRDEIYVQLMRQTTDNKRDESLHSGWELIAMCLYFFPPSPKCHSCLEGYISQHLEHFSNTESVPSSEMSAHCLRRLKRAQKMGNKMAIYKPTLEELEHAKATIFSPTMFGNTLEDIMLLQRDRYPDRQLPWIQTVLSEEILRLHGAQTEGIFRVSGDIDEVNSLKTQCDKWILPTDCTDPHIPASLLKMWYRELFEPVIPAQFYQACVENFSNAEAAIAIVCQLPHLNHLVLCYLIRFLQRLASPGNVAFTKMDVNNLAMVMAPNCLRYESKDLLTIYQNVQKEMGFMRTLILYLDTSFMEGIV